MGRSRIKKASSRPQTIGAALACFMREYLDPVTKTDYCARYVDDIGIAGNTPLEVISNLKAVFQCIRKPGLKLAIDKCHLGAQEVECLFRLITPESIAPPTHKIKNFLQKFKNPKSKKATQWFVCFVNYCRNYISRLLDNVILFYTLPKSENKVTITQQPIRKNAELNKALDAACGLALKQPLLNKKLLLATDASFQAPGYALMTEENLEQNICTTRKLFAPIAFGSQVFTTAQLKISTYCKEIRGFYHAFLDYSHMLWDAQ